MRRASRRPTGDETVRNTSAHAVPPAELTMTRASTRIESNRCCWTHCQTNTLRAYLLRAGPERPARGPSLVRSGRVGHPVAVEAGRHAPRELDHGLRLAVEGVGIEE